MDKLGGGPRQVIGGPLDAALFVLKSRQKEDGRNRDRDGRGDGGRDSREQPPQTVHLFHANATFDR